MEAKPLVSVVIPAYNCSRYIGEALESIFAQDCPDTEIIVVNDGSTDDTGKVLSAFEPRIRVVEQANAGAAAARNNAIREARGKYIAFLDADDLWLPGKLITQVRYLDNHPEVGLVYCGWLEWFPDDKGNFVKPVVPPPADLNETDPEFCGWLYNRLLFDCYVHTSTAVLRSEIVRAAGWFDLSLRRGQDYDYWFRVSRLAPIHKLRAVLSLYRIHPKSITNVPHAQNYGHLVLKKALDRWGRVGPDGTVTPKRAMNEVFARCWSGYGYTHYTLGDPKLALDAFKRCVRYQPFSPGAWRNLMRSAVKVWRGRHTRA
jgi:glycosyltransferase involved in cell wall biosynthesis